MRKELLDLAEEVEEEIKSQIDKINKDAMYNSKKVIEAFQ